MPARITDTQLDILRLIAEGRTLGDYVPRYKPGARRGRGAFPVTIATRAAVQLVRKGLVRLDPGSVSSYALTQAGADVLAQCARPSVRALALRGAQARKQHEGGFGAMRVALVPVGRVVATQEPERLDQAIVERAKALLVDGWDLSVVPPLRGYFATEQRPDGSHYENFEITDGHHRYVAAVELGYDKVPVVNDLAMKRSDRAFYTRAVKRYRKRIDHPFVGAIR